MELKAFRNTRYFVSKQGDVYSASSSKYLAHIDDGRGYPCVTLWIDGDSEKYKVHRLVAEIYVDNPNNLLEVNHIDGNKYNNDFSNLEWVSHTENMKHAWLTGLMVKGSATKIAKLDETTVEEIKLLFMTGMTNQEIAERYLVARGTISKIRKLETWKHVRPDLKFESTSPSKYKTKLEISDVKDIRNLSLKGVSNEVLAKQFGVHNGTIHAIVNYKTYTNI